MVFKVSPISRTNPNALVPEAWRLNKNPSSPTSPLPGESSQVKLNPTLRKPSWSSLSNIFACWIPPDLTRCRRRARGIELLRKSSSSIGVLSGKGRLKWVCSAVLEDIMHVALLWTIVTFSSFGNHDFKIVQFIHAPQWHHALQNLDICLHQHFPNALVSMRTRMKLRHRTYRTYNNNAFASELLRICMEVGMIQRSFKFFHSIPSRNAGASASCGKYQILRVKKYFFVSVLDFHSPSSGWWIVHWSWGYGTRDPDTQFLVHSIWIQEIGKLPLRNVLGEGRANITQTR